MKEVLAQTDVGAFIQTAARGETPSRTNPQALRLRITEGAIFFGDLCGYFLDAHIRPLKDLLSEESLVRLKLRGPRPGPERRQAHLVRTS